MAKYQYFLLAVIVAFVLIATTQVEAGDKEDLIVFGGGHRKKGSVVKISKKKNTIVLGIPGGFGRRRRDVQYVIEQE